MATTFERLGYWHDALSERRPEPKKTPEKPAKIEYLSGRLAAIESQTGLNAFEEARKIVASNGFKKELPWHGFKARLFCSQEDYEQLSRAQEIGVDTMTFKRSEMRPELLTDLERYLDGYEFAKPLKDLPSQEVQPYAVLVRKVSEWQKN